MLHGHLRVSQQVLLLSQLGLGIENLQVEAAVGEPDDDVALPYLLSLFRHFLHDDASLFGRDVDNLDGDDRSVEPDIVLEFTFRHLSYGHVLRTDPQGAPVVAEDKPQHHSQQKRPSCYIGDMLSLQAPFPLDYSVHNDFPL